MINVLFAHKSLDIRERQAKLEEEREKQLLEIRFVTGTNNSNHAYLDALKAGAFHPNVMSHTKANKNDKNKDEICHVLDCGGIGKNACRSKTCFEQKRRFCDIHYKDGGHKKHNGRELKPDTTKVSNIKMT